jgi:glycosyltransferase involved in cell wall biosynthesis
MPDTPKLSRSPELASGHASLHVWQYYGLRSQVWLYRLLQELTRYHPHLLMRRAWLEQRPLDEFPWPADRLWFFPNHSAITRLVGKIRPLLRTGSLNVLNSWDSRFVNELCIRIDARVLHIHLGWMAPAFLTDPEAIHIPTLVTTYGIDVFRARHYSGYPEALQTLFAQRIPFVAISQCLKDGMLALGAPPELVTVIPVGIRLADLPSEDETIQKCERRMRERARFRIITVGRLVEYKAPQQLPQIARMLRDRGVEFEWNLVG